MARKQHTTETLRNTLFEEMESLIDGETTEGRAHAVARLANAIIASSRLELDHAAPTACGVEPVRLGA